MPCDRSELKVSATVTELRCRMEHDKYNGVGILNGISNQIPTNITVPDFEKEKQEALARNEEDDTRCTFSDSERRENSASMLIIFLFCFRYPDGSVKLRNPHIELMDQDILYHLALGSESHDLVSMFGDIKVSAS